MHDASKVVKRELDRRLDTHDGVDHDGVRPLRRIAVIGRAGAGKTTVALALGAAHGLPVVHLDPLAWAPGWRPVSAADFDARHATAIAADMWVLDGGYLSRAGWAERLARADVVVLVEAPLLVCLSRIMRRGIGLRGIGLRGRRGRGTGRQDPVARRPDLPAGCDDELGLGFVFWTLTWGWRTRAALRPLRRCESGLPRLVRARTGTLPPVTLPPGAGAFPAPPGSRRRRVRGAGAVPAPPGSSTQECAESAVSPRGSAPTARAGRRAMHAVVPDSTCLSRGDDI